jgi:hypothetical protein
MSKQFVVASYFDGELEIEKIEAETAAQAMMVHVQNTMGFQELEVEDVEDPGSIAEALSEEGGYIDYLAL